MGRRRFTPEFKLEAVKLVKERGVAVRQAAADLGLHRQIRPAPAPAADPLRATSHHPWPTVNRDPGQQGPCPTGSPVSPDALHLASVSSFCLLRASTFPDSADYVITGLVRFAQECKRLQLSSKHF